LKGEDRQERGGGQDTENVVLQCPATAAPGSNDDNGHERRLDAIEDTPDEGDIALDEGSDR
jgi:hypothetical protein